VKRLHDYTLFERDFRMATSLVKVAPQKPLEDPLAYLPCSSVLEFRKGDVIYNHDQPHQDLYLVLTGTVKVTRLSDHGNQLLVDLYATDDFFGEAAFVNPSQAMEQATAHQNTTLMAWKASDIEELILKRPMLAVALLQAFGQRSIGLTQRLESLSNDRIDRRLARSLIRFADRMGTTREDGGIQMEPLTHELLAQYVGTSRELITCHMTNFRKLGYLEYSRRAIVVHRDALGAWVREN
jgi:CRP/FNR family cyclic AMP-dependent transcriptional regulator